MEGGVGIKLQSAPKVFYSYYFSPGLRYHYLLHKTRHILTLTHSLVENPQMAFKKNSFRMILPECIAPQKEMTELKCSNYCSIFIFTSGCYISMHHVLKVHDLLVKNCDKFRLTA